MSRDLSGTYTLPENTQAVTGATLSSDKYNAINADLAAALNAPWPASAGFEQTIAQSFPTIAGLTTATLTDGEVVTVTAGYNGELETFVVDTASSLTPNGTTVVGPLAVGGNAVSTRTTFKSEAELIADSRIHPDGTILSVLGVFYEVNSTAGEVTLGGGKFASLAGPTYAYSAITRNKLLLDPKTITGATSANPVVITSAAHGFSDGDTVKLVGLGGIAQVNNRFYTVGGATANTFNLLDEKNVDIDGTAFTAYTSGGTADKMQGLQLLLDAAHEPINVSGITTTGTPARGMRIEYKASTKIGDCSVAVDNDFARLGVHAGPSIGSDNATIFAWQDMAGYINNSTDLATTPDFLGNPPTVVDNANGTKTVTHASTGKMSSPEVFIGTPSGAVNAYDFQTKVISYDQYSFTFGFYDKLSGTLEYDGANWVATTNSFVKPAIVVFGGYIDLNFGTTVSTERPNLTGVTNGSIGPYIYELVIPAANRIRLRIADLTGANVHGTPVAGMKCNFTSEGFVLLEDTAKGFVSFRRPLVELNPNHMDASSGALLISGTNKLT